MSARGFRFHIVDVFCAGKYSGNPLAVIVLRAPLLSETMQRIAAEFNFPETTFVAPAARRDGSFDVRIFTPRQEVPFAGHPTLGTAHVIRRKLAGGRPARVTLNLKVGKIPVAYEPETDLLWMKQKQPVFGKVHDPARVARLLGVGTDAIDAGFPVREVSTGLPFLLVPFRSLAMVRKARLEERAFRRHFGPGAELPLFIFCRETYDPAHRLNSRMFAPQFGIAEDPATGSANGCLAGYILEHGYLAGDRLDLAVEQGYEIGRKSLLHLRARGVPGGRMDIRVGGRVLEVAEGRLQ